MKKFKPGDKVYVKYVSPSTDFDPGLCPEMEALVRKGKPLTISQSVFGHGYLYRVDEDEHRFAWHAEWFTLASGGWEDSPTQSTITL